MNQKPVLVLALFNENSESIECVFQPVRCDQCKHWADDADEKRRERSCLRVRSITPPCIGDLSPPDVAGAYIVDFEQVGGTVPLETFPDFGCSLFEVTEARSSAQVPRKASAVLGWEGHDGYVTLTCACGAVDEMGGVFTDDTIECASCHQSWKFSLTVPCEPAETPP